MQSRQHRIKRLKENPVISVLIVGAGINGIGTFRDLALQGIDVLMVDRGDYCNGASAASSHMVHGGIRYLENGEFRLVREAVQERNRLIENAPHLVKPLPTTYPIFKWFSGLLNAPLKFLGLINKPAERGAVIIKVGMTLYDIYTRKQKTVPRHVFKNRKKSLAQFPKLNSEIIFTGTYYDGSMPSPERIALELVLDAVKANPDAIPLSYTSLLSANGDTVVLRDEINGEEIEVKPLVVINAGGPWIDFVNQAMGKESQLIGGTKGSHLILDHPELKEAIGDHELFFENKDGRIVLVFPLMDKVMIGTSDIRIEDPDEVCITEDEVDYFFEMLERVFPTIKVDKSHIVYTFSGVRPLPYSGADYTGNISRDHSINVLDSNGAIKFPIYSLVGGKWTSFRALSEQTCDKALEYLGVERKIDTANIPIGGGTDYPRRDAEKDAWLASTVEHTGIDQDKLTILFNRYGTRAEEIAKYVSEEKDDALTHLAEYSRREIAYILTHEEVNHLDDLILRRTMIAKLGKLTPELLDELGEVAGKALGWTGERVKEEIKRTIQILAEKHKIEFNKFVNM